MAKWLRFHFRADFRLDAAKPRWTASVLKEVRLPRWTYESHDRYAAIFARAPQTTAMGPTEVSIRLLPGEPMPTVTMDIEVQGKWGDDDRGRHPHGFGDIYEEAEALVILLGCRSPSFDLVKTELLR